VTSSTSPAAGVHLPWADVPAAVRTWAARVGGGAPRSTRDLSGGFSPGATTVLDCPRGAVFVKAVGAGLNPDSPELHRREAVVSAGLPPAPQFPCLLDVYDDGDWVALAFVAIDGRPPLHPWDRTQLRSAVCALDALHDALTPNPVADAQSAAETLAGSTLLHCDVRSDNLLVTAAGVVFVDWPHACVGAPVFDLVAWAPSVELEGGPPPEELLALSVTGASSDRDAVAPLVAAFGGFLVRHSLQPSPPGLPTLRAFQAAQGAVALAWVRRLMGW
jgi:Phosphotransferase enzyme family